MHGAMKKVTEFHLARKRKQIRIYEARIYRARQAIEVIGKEHRV